MQLSPQISSDWQLVLDSYLKLEESWKKELFLKSMTPNQKNYLLQLVHQLDSFEDLHSNKLTGGDAFLPKPNMLNLRPSLLPLHSNQPINSAVFKKDAHLLSHKDYKISKRKWWATLLPIFVIAIAISSLSGLVFFAWIGGGLPKLSFLASIPGNKAKADELTYDDWIKQFDIQDKSESADSSFDGLTNLDKFKLGLNPSKYDENNNGIADGLDYINKDNSLIKNAREDAPVWSAIDSQTIFLQLQMATLHKLGLYQSGQSLLKLNKIIIPKINNLEVTALPESTVANETSTILKKQLALVHYLGTNWAGENLSVWFSNEGKIEKMLPGDSMEAYLQDDQGNSWYQQYILKAANTFTADSSDIFKDESNISNLKIVLCQPENGCNKAFVLTFEIQQTNQITFDKQADAIKV